MVRCFIGFLLPDFLKEKVHTIQEKLKQMPINCKMVENENLHINFSFLGEVEEKDVDAITNKLKKVYTGPPIRAKIGGIKFVPNENFVRVIVLDVVSDQLRCLAEKIKKDIGGDVKPLHITLCRVKKIDEKEHTIRSIKEIDLDHVDFYVNSISLIKSELKKAGPVYTILYENKL